VELNYYQERARETAIYKNHLSDMGDRIAYNCIGFVGEAGEVANEIKKAIRNNGFVASGQYLHKNFAVTHGEDSRANKVADELGDSLWYLAMLAKECGYTLDEIASRNLDKLKQRHKDQVVVG
jgi:NTP pyrophosphatase (non-canonical NTP hydrolase)